MEKLVFKFSVLTTALLTISAFCNTDVRDWEYESGERFRAELVNVDEELEWATFRTDGKQDEYRVAVEKLCAIDIAWLKEWTFVSEKLEKEISKFGGEVIHYRSEGVYPTDFFVYKPNSEEEPSRRPALILFHPSGKAQRYLLRNIESASELGLVLVACAEFRNTGDEASKEAEMLARFKELLPAIEETVPHDPKKLMMGGASGGAWRAYHFAAEIDRPWHGILANGGWLGGRKYYDLQYPAMKVAMINGNQDHAANSWIKKDSKVLESRGCEIGIFAFEGGHQVPPAANLTDALSWLLE